MRIAILAGQVGAIVSLAGQVDAYTPPAPGGEAILAGMMIGAGLTGLTYGASYGG